MNSSETMKINSWRTISQFSRKNNLEDIEASLLHQSLDSLINENNVLNP